MSVTLTDEQAAALSRVMDRHERHHYDAVCTSNGLQDDCAACRDIGTVRDALTREPAPLPPEEEHRRLADSMMCRCGSDGCWACGGVFDPGPLAHLCALHAADPGEYLPCLPIKREPAPCLHREQLIKARHLLIAYRMQCHCDRDGVEWRCAACRKSIEGGLAVEEAIEQPCAAPAGCQLRKALEAVSDDARRWPCTCGPISLYGEADTRCDNCTLQQTVVAALASAQPCAAPASARCLGCEDRPFGALWSPNARPHTCEKGQPCAAPGEPSQEDFDGMQRWLDDALRTCRDDDHKRLKYLQADVRILAAARRWVARAAPGEAREWELIDSRLELSGWVYSADGRVEVKPGDRIDVYRRRAPEAKR